LVSDVTTHTNTYSEGNNIIAANRTARNNPTFGNEAVTRKRGTQSVAKTEMKKYS